MDETALQIQLFGWLARPKLAASVTARLRAWDHGRYGGAASTGMSGGWRPQRDSNPRFGLERATS